MLSVFNIFTLELLSNKLVWIRTKYYNSCTEYMKTHACAHTHSASETGQWSVGVNVYWGKHRQDVTCKLPSLHLVNEKNTEQFID